MSGISGAKLARELGCSPGSITNLKRDKVIEVLPSGKFDRTGALKAIAKTTSGSGGGWEGDLRHGKSSLRERAEKLLESKTGKKKAKTVDPIGYAHAAGQAHMAERLRGHDCFEVLCALGEGIGLSRAQARKAALAHVGMTNLWALEVLRRTIGEPAAIEFDTDLHTWLSKFNNDPAELIMEPAK